MNIRHIYIFQNKVCIAEENRIEKKSAKLFAPLKMTKMCSNLLNWVKWSRLRNFPFFSVNERDRERGREGGGDDKYTWWNLGSILPARDRDITHNLSNYLKLEIG